ncbi:2TM domain-containing protein [Flagellimonas meridianipacifica]|uniref:2TM domain-containing protein n=1 Tax=Flagellimonas meridianipacifica TaxID=1080225 RepID=A0A2T0MA62_9FLAO|nr:2TM domain-containing protein [Allomuricauda pacifica]PRX54312.1 2TM domain-containing protein [Allomuricauda pacifica]
MENITDYKYRRAKEQVECIKGFYSNLTAYAIVIPLLAYLNYMTSSFPWIIFPAIGWGIGLVGHWMSAYDKNPFLGKGWEQRKIKELMEKDQF